MRSTLERKDLLLRRTQLQGERASWLTDWRDISDYLLPRHGRYLPQDRNRGERRNRAILDSTAGRAHDVLAAGMMAGMTSPARPWLRLQTPDDQLNKFGPVKLWLAEVTRLMLRVFARSNTYRAFHHAYRELGGFGTSAGILLGDFENVIHHYPLTTGEYCISTDARGTVNTLLREYQMTVAQLVREFGRENCSTIVQSLYDRGALDQWVTVVHLIEPRDDREPGRRDALNMAWRSVQFELGGNQDNVLRESGFKRFPALCPRWDVIGGDIYGSGPGQTAIGDIKQLQHQQLRKGQAIDYLTKPPLQFPSSAKNREVDMLPGGVTYYDGPPGQKIESMWDVRLDLNHLLLDIQDVRQRMNSAFYADLFLMISQTDGKMTATEVAERHEEKMLVLGPVIERLHNEMLDPCVEIAFEHMAEAGILPPPPEELQGANLQVEYTSILAQAQRAIGANGVDRYVANLGAVAQFKPDVLDKLDADAWADAYADMLGVDPELIVPSDKVAVIRQQRAQAQAQAQRVAMAEQAASAANKAAGAAVQMQQAPDVMSALTGYTSPMQ